MRSSLGKVNGYQKRPISQVTYPPSRLFPEAKNGTVKKKGQERDADNSEILSTF